MLQKFLSGEKVVCYRHKNQKGGINCLHNHYYVMNTNFPWNPCYYCISRFISIEL